MKKREMKEKRKTLRILFKKRRISQLEYSLRTNNINYSKVLGIILTLITILFMIYVNVMEIITFEFKITKYKRAERTIISIYVKIKTWGKI